MKEQAARWVAGLAIACLVVAASGACTGLGGLAGGEPDADAGDGSIAPDVTIDDASSDAPACKATISSDPKNCGRCGHDCLGGSCSSGHCAAIQLAAIGNAPLTNVLVTAQHVFVSAYVTKFTETGGLWRIPKGGGNAELVAPTVRLANSMVVFGDTLYFASYDDLGATGGVYSCPLAGPFPCTPLLIATGQTPHALVVANGAIFYVDDAMDKGVMRFSPGGTPALFRTVAPDTLYVDGAVAYGTISFGLQADQVRLLQIAADSSLGVVASYMSNVAGVGFQIEGNASAIYFTAFDASSSRDGGTVQRHPRTSALQSCTYGGNGNKRPFGVHIDASRIYWTNQGTGAERPYVDGSIASCPLAGCCTTPDVLHSNSGMPTGITGDADALYFVTYGSGSVWKIAKP